MSMRRRYEPMGGEVDSSQMRVSNTYPPDNSIGETESVPSGSFVDDLTLRVRSLLMNFDDGEVGTNEYLNRVQEDGGQNEFNADTVSSSGHEYCGFDYRGTVEPLHELTSKHSYEEKAAIHEHGDHKDTLCSGCSQLGKAGSTDGENVGSSETLRTSSVVLIPQVEKLLPQAPRIVLSKTSSSAPPNFSTAVSNQQRVENPPTYQLFSTTLNANMRVKSPGTVGKSNSGKSKTKMHSDVASMVEVQSTRTSDLRRHKFYVQPLPTSSRVTDDQPLEREAERSWSEIIISPESFSKKSTSSGKQLPTVGGGSINHSYKDYLPKQVFLLPKTVTRKERSMSPRHLAGEDADLRETWKSNASAVVDKEYEFLNYQSLSSMSDFDSIGRDTPPLSASSIGSSKRLEWDNGADIGYSIANANSKLRRMVPNTARSEPEGISLINETLNNTSNVTPVSFPSSLFPSFIGTAQDISTSRQTLMNSISCDTRDDLDRSSPEASLSRSDSKRSVIYNSVRDMQQQSQSSSGNSRSLDKVACHSFKNQSCPDLTNLAPLQKQSKAFGALSKSDEVMSLTKSTPAAQNTTLMDFPGSIPASERFERNFSSQLTRHNSNSSSSSKDLLKESSFDNTPHACSCQQSHLTEKESKHYPVSESEKSYKSRDEHEESFELTTDGGNQVYNFAHLSHHDADVEWINENAVFDPSVHYFTEMSEIPGNYPIGSLNSGSFLLLSNNPGKINENQFSRNVGNLLSDDNSNEYSSGVENKPHIRWYPFSSVNIQDIKNVSTQTAMSFIAKQANEAAVQVASEQQTSSPEVTKLTSEESSDDSMKYHQNVSSRNPQSQFNQLQVSKKSDEASSCHEFHSSCETVLFGQNMLRDRSEHPVPHTLTALNASQKRPKSYPGISESPQTAGLNTSLRKYPVNPDYLASVEPSSCKNISKEHSTNSNSETSSRNSKREIISPRLVSDADDPLVYQDCNEQSNLEHGSTSRELGKDSKTNHRTFCWLTEEKELEHEDRSDITSSPDLYSRERKLGVGQCETVSRSGTGEEATLERPKMSSNYLKPQYSSSDSDAINYPQSGGISNSDEIPDSDSSTRSSVEGYSSGEPRKHYMQGAPSAIPTQRYYFSNLSPVNIYGGDGPGNANQDISGRSGCVIGDSNQEMPQSGKVTADANQQVFRSKPIFSADYYQDVSNQLNGSRGVKPNSKSIIDNANQAISDSKVISSAARRLNATDLYSQSQPISPFMVSTNLEKSNSDPVISLPRNSTNRHKNSVVSIINPLDFKAKSSNKKVSRGKSCQTDNHPTTPYSERFSVRLGAEDNHTEVSDRFKSSSHQVNDFLQFDSYDTVRNDSKLIGKMTEGCESRSTFVQSHYNHPNNVHTDPYNDSQSDGNSSERVLLQKHTMDVLPSTLNRVPRMDASSSHSHQSENAKKYSNDHKPKMKDSGTNVAELLHSSKSGIDSRIESLEDGSSRKKYNRNQDGSVHSDHFPTKVVDDCNAIDKGLPVLSNHPLSHPTSSETDNVRKYLRTFEKHYVSIGVQVSEPAAVSKSCNFCNRSVEPSYRHNCYAKEIFKGKLSHVLEENLDPFERHCKRSGASFCVFPSGCVCCCSKTLQEAFNFHRSELAERIQARKNGVLEQARMKHVINFPNVENYNNKDSRNVPSKISNKEKSSNKENKIKLKRKSASLTSNKQKERQRTLLTFNRTMSKIYSQRLKNEILKGKVNFHRHENLIAF